LGNQQPVGHRQHAEGPMAAVPVGPVTETG
jgi:hypothetical protein